MSIEPYAPFYKIVSICGDTFRIVEIASGERIASLYRANDRGSASTIVPGVPLVNCNVCTKFQHNGDTMERFGSNSFGISVLISRRDNKSSMRYMCCLLGFGFVAHLFTEFVELVSICWRVSFLFSIFIKRFLFFLISIRLSRRWNECKMSHFSAIASA